VQLKRFHLNIFSLKGSKFIYRLVLGYERLLFSPRGIDWFIIITLGPLSLIYSIYMFFRRIFTKRKEFIMPIISVGNLVVGGSGKTPFIISLASN